MRDLLSLLGGGLVARIGKLGDKTTFVDGGISRSTGSGGRSQKVWGSDCKDAISFTTMPSVGHRLNMGSVLLKLFESSAVQKWKFRWS